MTNRNTETKNMYLPEGQLISTPQNRELTASVQGLERAMHGGIILEGMVILCDADFNLHIDFPALPETTAVIPRTEAVYTTGGEPVKDIAILTRVGKAVCFKILGMDTHDGHLHLTLSRRAAQAECMTSYLSTLEAGDVIRARVTHMESFGAFVDIGCGIPSLLSVDTISISRISHPKDRLWNGQLIWAVVRSTDRGSDGLPHRIFVSTRELLGTWEENAARFKAGQTVAGIVRSVEDYGVFVELAPNLAGLAELKEDARGGIDHKLIADTMIGRRAAVFIKSIIPERMKIKLVLIDAYQGDLPSVPQLNYFIQGDQTSHIDRWVYSPAGAKKRIETVFGA